MAISCWAALFFCAGRLLAGDLWDGFARDVSPLLKTYCYDCHAGKDAEAGIAFDELETDNARIRDTKFWSSVLRNVRADVMPPADMPQPSLQEMQTLANWIKKDVFAIDYDHPDPGPALVRRLNRTEYQNTIQELFGIDFDASQLFPADDTGYGFDNNAAALTMSTILVEKYIQAAEAIVDRAVPTVSRVVGERPLRGKDFRLKAIQDGDDAGDSGDADRLNFNRPAVSGVEFELEREGTYELDVEIRIRGSFDYDPGRCKVAFRIDGSVCQEENYVWAEAETHDYKFTVDWQPGRHAFEFELTTLDSLPDPERRGRNTSVTFEIRSLNVRGPLEPDRWVKPPNYERLFSRDAPPLDAAEREQYAREVLRQFAFRAFRGPVDDRTLDRLVEIAADLYQQPGKTFEAGIGRSLVAMLASPRFLYRKENVLAKSEQETYALVDEYALASRLSYFLWSSMPDRELLELAGSGDLRKQLEQQVARMVHDPRSEQFLSGFVGQWLRSREVDHVMLDARAIVAADAEPLSEEERGTRGFGRRRFRGPFVQFDSELKTAMRRETEMVFGHILRNDRSLLELLDSDYTFLNQRLATHYGIEGVEGDEMRFFQLPDESPRGGILTQGTLLTVTSNPTRTSPVKRGLYILENLLGTPPAAPPPNIPELDEAKAHFDGKQPTLREVLAFHRENELCASCHGRMDPLGLALENFNALGMWREKDAGQPIDATGELISGERFENINQLKSILVENKRGDFYRCLTEKLLTYALGRGIDYYDTQTVDQIVDALESQQGRFSALLSGVIHSPQFQRHRDGLASSISQNSTSTQPRAAASSLDHPTGQK